VAAVSKTGRRFISSAAVAKTVTAAKSAHKRRKHELERVGTIEAIPAYNLTRGRNRESSFTTRGAAMATC